MLPRLFRHSSSYFCDPGHRITRLIKTMTFSSCVCGGRNGGYVFFSYFLAYSFPAGAAAGRDAAQRTSQLSATIITRMVVCRITKIGGRQAMI